MSSRQLRTRYPGSCAACGAFVPRGIEAWWDAEVKRLTCIACGPMPAGGDNLDSELKDDEVSLPLSGPAGGSAQRQHDRRKAGREQRVRGNHPRLGGLMLALSDHPQTTTAWARGAEGERRVGERLDSLRADGIVVLHDRRIPHTRANIDHLVVAPTGVWIVDAKHYSGQVTRRDVGGWRRSDERLFVGRRDCTKLVAGMAFQHDAVRTALARHDDIPIHRVLCFVEAEWSFLARPFDLGGVLVAWPKATVEAIRRPGTLEPENINRIGETLLRALPAA